MAKRKKSGSISKKIQVRASNGMNHNMCCCCDSSGLGWIFLILGILYLFSDLGWWNWWNISWWTILFLIFGIKMIKKR